MPDDDATAAAPVGPLPTTDLGPAPAPGEVLAYSAGTTSMPVIEYRAPRLRPVWIIVLVLVSAGAVAAAMFFLGRTTARQETAPPEPVQTSAPVQQPPVVPPPVAAPPPAPAAPVAPPAAAVQTPTAAIPAPPAPTTSTPPLATPQARIAEPIICRLHNQYPQMQPVDLALTLVDKGIYRTYDEAALVVGLVLKDGCHGI